MSAGTSTVLNVPPSSSESSHTWATCAMRSTSPLKPSSRPMGTWIGTACAPRRSFSMERQR